MSTGHQTGADQRNQFVDVILGDEVGIEFGQLKERTLETKYHGRQVLQELCDLLEKTRKESEAGKYEAQHGTEEDNVHTNSARYSSLLQIDDQTLEYVCDHNTGKHRCQYVSQEDNGQRSCQKKQNQRHDLRVGELFPEPVNREPFGRGLSD